MILYIDISNYTETRAHTGIQRVVREITTRLLSKKIEFEYFIIYFDIDLQKFVKIKNREVLDFLNDVKTYKFKYTKDTLDIDHIKNGDIFFDMDGAWNNGLKRTYLYKRLKENNAQIFNFIYDLVPIVKPQFSHINTIRNFATFIFAVYKYSDLVFFDSRSAEKDFLDIKKQIDIRRNISTRVVKLGSDIHLKEEIKEDFKYSKIIDSKYILFVGTLEPRKNQALMLDVFEKLEKKYRDLHVVFVGREGWNNSELINKIKNHTLLNKKLYWLNQVTDEELSVLYENAYICTYLSEYEGFGLPIAESLGYGKITITSKNSSMYEVGKNFADYLMYNSFNELHDTITSYLDNNNLYELKKDFIKENYKPYTWDLTYQSIKNIISNYTTKQMIQTPDKLQFVFISIDFDNLVGTIAAIDKYIDFVESYIIVTSEKMVEKFKTIGSNNEIIVINENEILDEKIEIFKKRDHQTKNWILRASLLKINLLKDIFIMLDDDNRPLKKIPIEHFVENGKYNAYYFYDLLEWNSFQTDYDHGQHHMKTLLDKDGYELLSYSAHKPQVIDKKLFAEVVAKYYKYGKKVSIDEWSIYFNYCISNYPYLFNKKKYDTLNWPGSPSDWNMLYTPDEYTFENYYANVYTYGLYKDNPNLTNEEKIQLKESQLIPYNNNIKLNIEQQKYRKTLNIVHGKLSFTQKEKHLYCFNFPYYIEAYGGSWIKIPLNYKAINLHNTKVEIMYYINNSIGAYTTIFIDQSYDENRIDFAISCTSLKKGLYDLLIDVKIDSKNVYGKESPYLVKLCIK